MSYTEMPPFTGEIPHPFGWIPQPFGDTPMPGCLAGDMHIGGAIGDVSTGPPVRLFGVMGTGPCKGIMENPPVIGNLETGP